MKDKSIDTTLFILLDRIAIHQRSRDRCKKRIGKQRSVLAEEMFYNHKEIVNFLEDVVFRVGAF